MNGFLIEDIEDKGARRETAPWGLERRAMEHHEDVLEPRRWHRGRTGGDALDSASS